MPICTNVHPTSIPLVSLKDNIHIWIVGHKDGHTTILGNLLMNCCFFPEKEFLNGIFSEVSGHKLESSQARVFHPHFSVLEGIVNSMEQNSRVFCQIDVQEFHLWRRKGEGHLSPFVILKLFSRRRKGKEHFDHAIVLLKYIVITSWRRRWKNLQNHFSDNLQHCCSNVL